MNCNDNIGFIESKINSFIFKAPKRHYLKNKSEKANNFEKYIETFNSNDGKIRLSFFVIHPHNMDKSQEKLPYILWSHGNASDLIDLYPTIKNFYSQLNRQIGIIVYDYEGYGSSSGTCRETNCYRDLKIMIDFCCNKLKISRNCLFLLGESLGTGIVIDYVSRHPDWETPIILLAPYKTISRVLIDPHWIYSLTNIVINSIDRFTSIDKIDKIKCPIIIYHGIKDTIINYRHSVELRRKNRTNTTLILLKKANHNDILSYINPQEIWNIVFNHINSSKNN